MKKAIKAIKIVIDATMYVIFLLLMGRHLLSGAVHEWLGISVFVLFIGHNLLNYKWYGALFKGKYSVLRIAQTTINFLLLIAMILCIASSLLVSGVVFKWMNLSGAGVGREIHLVITAWVFIFMSIHLGFHWSNFVSMGKKIKMNRIAKIILVWFFRIAVLALVAFGIYVFITRRFYEEMFLLTEFKFFDYGKSVFIYLIETFSISIVFVASVYYAKKCYTFISLKHKNTIKKLT